MKYVTQLLYDEFTLNSLPLKARYCVPLLTIYGSHIQFSWYLEYGTMIESAVKIPAVL